MDEPAEKALSNFKASGYYGTLFCDIQGEHAPGSKSAIYYSYQAATNSRPRTHEQVQFQITIPLTLLVVPCRVEP